jgi:hypothetical protein
MRIVIQDQVGKGYFDGATWGADSEQARSFETVAQAEAFCEDRNVTHAFIVVKFNDPAQDIRFPIGERDALLVSRPPTTRIRRLA